MAVEKHKELTQEEKVYILERCKYLQELVGVPTAKLHLYFDGVTQNQILELGVKEQLKETLTQFEKRFCYEFVKDFNAQKAIDRVRADHAFSESNNDNVSATKILERQKVRDKIQQLLESVGIDKEYILLTVKEAMERCLQARPVVDRKGKQVYVQKDDGEVAALYQFDSGGVFKGAELLGKSISLWKDNVMHSNDPNNPFNNQITALPTDPIEAARVYQDMMKDSNKK